MSCKNSSRYKTRFNLGAVAYLQSSVDDCGLRNVIYKTDDYIENFPFIFHAEHLDACCEMNLFLIQRLKGEYSLKKNKRQTSDSWSQQYAATRKGEPLDIKTIESISKDLKLFLDFLIENDLSYLEVIAAPISESAHADVSQMPVWKYQRYLVERVKRKDLAWNTANRMIRRVREFYIWSYHRGSIGKLPFELELKAIHKKKSSDYDVLFSMPSANQTALQAWISNLTIPKKFKQKAVKPNGLQPFNRSELASLLNTDTAKHPTNSLFLKCAYLAGFRSFEVVQIDYNEVVNPVDHPRNAVFKIGLVRKQHLPKPINITRTLMQKLFDYTTTASWKTRRKKHEEKYGVDNPEHPLPLFINKSGERMAGTSASDVIAYVRKEQREKGLPVLERGYHDLRATFGTYLAIYLIEKLVDTRRVRTTLRKWLGHESMKTTEMYIDFAKVSEPSEFGAMHEWVEDIYKAVRETK
ncbi:tyrosine-type recombinase/integrase [Alishewanella sp. 16-MA]|uniref:Tyrosine-type recombinase/integrase n=1 Tax=Alishewanella maricola TaxID=2795740 RepID=A0ABS8C7N5_9ALTE|nr:site-specific integrase [Alishewanella maricola]MCB5228311.1 tyrosine-type recombinase/integrase [Alishewanella maricola]